MSGLSHRLFFALAPSARERALIGLHRDEVQGSHSLVSNDRLHLTLGITNNYEAFPEQIARRMMTIGDNVAAEPFRLALDRISAGARSIALRPSHRCAGIADLQHQLGLGLRRWNISREGWAFSPHVTLLYWEGQPFLRPISPILLEVTDFVLIHSMVGATQHRELARWQLSVRQKSFLFS